MNIEYFREFIIVADSGTYLAAATLLSMDNSVLARHIKKLEDELGYTLFRRGRHTLTLTKEGVFCYNKVKRSLGFWDGFIDELHSEYESGEYPEVLSVVTPFFGNSPLFNDICEKFNKKFANKQVSLTYTDDDHIVKKISNNEVDGAIGFTIPSNIDINISYIDIINLSFHAIYSSSISSTLSMEMIKNKKIYISTLDSRTGLKLILDNLIKNHKIEHSNIIEVQNYKSLLELVAANDGISFVPSLLTSSLPNSIKSIKLDPSSSLPMIFFWNKNNRSELIPQFVTYLRGEFKKI